MSERLNTYEKGVLNFISYPTDEGTYVAACNELCLLTEEKDAQLAKLNILAKAKRYLENVCKDELGEELLNQSLPKDIIKEFEKHVKEFLKKNAIDEFEKWNEEWEKKSGKIKGSSFLTVV